MASATTDMNKIIDNLPQSPEEAREITLKTLFLDMNMKCKGCGMVYRTSTDLEKLDITRYVDLNNPDAMSVDLTCTACGHSGMHTFRPNPFIMSRQGAF